MPRRSPSIVLIHIVWSTRGREPQLIAANDSALERLLAAKAAELGCQLLAFGCAEDHIHVLIRLAATTALAAVVQRMKGATSYLLPRVLDAPLSWQDGYWAASFAAHELRNLITYVREQRAHHGRGSGAEDWETDR